jgi:hypothetical protein
MSKLYKNDIKQIGDRVTQFDHDPLPKNKCNDLFDSDKSNRSIGGL